MTHWRRRAVGAQVGPGGYLRTPGARVAHRRGRYGLPGWVALAFLLAVAVILIAVSTALAHDEFRCSAAPYRSATGMDCCSAQTDCVMIPQATAFEARVGSSIEAAFPAWGSYRAETRAVVVNVIHPSCDDHGWSWMCRSGCLFRAGDF